MHSFQEIKTISQLHDQMTLKKHQLLKKIEQLSIPQIPANLDFETKNITIDKIFKQIPSEDRLNKYMEINNALQERKSPLKNYAGQYEIVKKAAQKIQSIKPQAKSIYELFASLDLPKIKDSFKQFKQKGLIRLDSFQVMDIENQLKPQKSQQIDQGQQNQQQFGSSKIQTSKATKFQRNTISEDYLYSVKQSEKYQQILPPSQYLKDDQLLITVCIYDSLNKQKTHQIVFLGDMKIIDLKRQIYCKIQKLSTTPQTVNSSKFSEHEERSFFLIQQNIFYQGTHHSQLQIDSLIKNIKFSYQTDLHKYSMNQFELRNLRVVFGRPYLFRHLGGCDHMIVFKDIRLYEKSGIDPDIRKKYPFTIFEAKMKRKKCQGCENLFANVACVGDKLKNGQTSYLCKECHQNIHNDLTNPKNKFMKVIPYLHQ